MGLLTGRNPVSRLQRCMFSDLLETPQELDCLIRHPWAFPLIALCNFIPASRGTANLI